MYTEVAPLTLPHSRSSHFLLFVALWEWQRLPCPGPWGCLVAAPRKGLSFVWLLK